MNEDPRVTMEELIAIFGEKEANDLYALVLQRRRPKLTLSRAQTESAIAVLEGRSKAKGDYEALGKAAAQWYRANPAGATLFNFLGGDDTMAEDDVLDAAVRDVSGHPAMRYARGQGAAQRGAPEEEAPAEAPASKRSPRRGPRPV